MKIQTLLLSIAALSMWTASAQVNIPILNPQFNADTLACKPGSGSCYAYGITGWLAGPQSGYVLDSIAQFPSAPPEGLYVAFLGYQNSTGSISQILGDTLQANTTYTLKVSVGAAADYPFTGYAVALLAGNVTLALGNKATPTGGTFVTEVVVYESGATPAQLGKPLQIVVKSLGTGQVALSGVSLAATAN
jgi:hypothetical protein